MLHSIHKLLIFFLADGFRHRLSLKTFGMLLLFDNFILSHFFETLITDAIRVVG